VVICGSVVGHVPEGHVVVDRSLVFYAKVSDIDSHGLRAFAGVCAPASGDVAHARAHSVTFFEDGIVGLFGETCHRDALRTLKAEPINDVDKHFVVFHQGLFPRVMLTHEVLLLSS
jgi:hypothetical protein